MTPTVGEPVEDRPSSSEGGPPTVVVVDDEELVRGALADLLEAMGFEVVGQAADGSEGVRMALAMRPQVVLMDLRMPGMNGIEAAGAIRSQDPGIQVVMLTAYGDPAHREGAERHGVFAYLLKGCPASEIDETLRRAAVARQSTER